jgi:hypothetical protein
MIITDHHPIGRIEADPAMRLAAPERDHAYRVGAFEALFRATVWCGYNPKYRPRQA